MSSIKETMNEKNKEITNQLDVLTNDIQHIKKVFSPFFSATKLPYQNKKNKKSKNNISEEEEEKTIKSNEEQVNI
jgi:hypothetical protein